MTNNELAKDIFQSSNIKGTFRLRSGQVSNEYFDKYLFESKPDLLDSIAKEMFKLLTFDVDYIAGLELGGIPIATMLSHCSKIPTLFIRKIPKEYGTCKLIEGGYYENKHVLIVEDIVTSAGAIIEGVKALRQDNAIVKYAFCVIDRESGGKEKLKELGVELKSLYMKSELG